MAGATPPPTRYGWHTFDHTLVDCFYATRLLSVGGYLVVDDVGFPAIRRVIDHLLSYPCYEFVRSTKVERRSNPKRNIARLALSVIPHAIKERVVSRSILNRANLISDSMVVLKKVSKDERNWNWHNERF